MRQLLRQRGTRCGVQDKGAQLLRSSKFAGSAEQAECAGRVRPNCKLKQPTQSTQQPPSHTLHSPFCIWQFDNNAGALLDTHTHTEAQWGKQTIAHCDCDCPMQMKLCSAALLCRVPLSKTLSLSKYAIKSHTEDTQRTAGQHYLSRCGKLIW